VSRRACTVVLPLIWSLALLALLALLAGGSGAAGSATGAASRVLVASGATLVLFRRARQPGAEQPVWRWFARVAACVCGGAVAELAVVAGEYFASPQRPWAAVPLEQAIVSLCSLVACALLYQGLIVWNRVSTRIADPGDWLNGVSAALAVAAALFLLDAAGLVPEHEDTLWSLAAVARFSALFIVLGTTLTVATLAGLSADPRLWAVAGVVVALMVVEAGTTFEGLATTWLPTAWVALVLVLAWATTVRAQPVRPQAATTQSIAVGTFVVLLASAAIVLVATRLPPESTWPVVVCGALAIVGVSTRVVRLIADLSTLAQTRQEALTDELTGLANRRAFAQQLVEFTASDRPLSVFLLDLDRFKEVNDRFGHTVGDDLLQRAGEELAAVCPPGAVLARLGGDEFALAVPGLDVGAAVELARSLSAAVHRTRVKDGVGHVSASVGVVWTAAAVEDGELLRRADIAMYQAKTTGSDVCLYDEALDRRGRQTALLTEELIELFDSGEFSRQLVVHYQPQVDVTSGQARGVEALVRWNHPRLGLLAPAAFLDLVEETGHMPVLTEFVLRTSVTDTLGTRRDPGLRLAVNLSPSALGEPGFLTLLDELVTGGLAPAELVLEITENLLMTDAEHAVTMTTQLRDRGFELSIDDYGTGYSSLSYLVDLPATEVKLDRSFTRRLVTDGRVREIVAGTVELAHRLGLRVIAEGVEDATTLELLHRLGVDETQGYLHARPMDTAELGSWLDRGQETGVSVASRSTGRAPWTTSTA